MKASVSGQGELRHNLRRKLDTIGASGSALMVWNLVLALLQFIGNADGRAKLQLQAKMALLVKDLVLPWLTSVYGRNLGKGNLQHRDEALNISFVTWP